MENVIGQKFERLATFERGSIDEKKRTVALSFSSEEPYERYWGVEILDHGAGSVLLDRLEDGAPLLVDHRTGDQVGVVEKAFIGGDRKGRAVVRFGRGQRASEIFQDVIDGIRQKVSVAYLVHKMVLEKEEDGKEFFRITSWEPLEVSLVAIPADNSVGVGRSVEGKKMEREMELEGKRPREIKRAAERAEREAVQDMLALGKRHGCLDEAARFIDEGKGVDEFKRFILEKYDQGSAPIRVADPDGGGGIGMTRREVEQYSVVRLLRAMVFGRENPAAMQAAGFELECHRAAVQAHQKLGLPNARGFVIPHDVLAGGSWRRDLSVGTATAGQELVATDLLAGSFIDVLRNLSVVFKTGARPLTGLVGNVAIPRKTAGSTAGWIATEGGDVSQSEPTFDQVIMSPKTLGAYGEITRNLLLQSSLAIENLVRQDLAAGVALEIDRAALYGSAASGEPRGVRNQTGINQPTAFAAAVPTREEIVAMESAVAVDNALMGNLGYVIDPAMRGSLKCQTVDAGSGRFTMEENDRLNGYKAGVTSQVTAGDVFFANWDELFIGFWGGLDILLDPYTHSLSGTLRITTHQSCDVCLRHPVSFAYNNDGV